MTFTQKIIGAVLVSLFAFALINFAYFSQIDNGASSNILDDPTFSGLNKTLSDNLKNVRGTTTTQSGNLDSQTATAGQDEGFSLTSIVSTVTSFKSMLFSSYNIITTALGTVFGIPSIVLNVIGGLLLATILILLWGVIKAGRR